MPAVLDLNADLGEGLDDVDDALYDVITSANVACGGHAGDAASMRRACEGCARTGVAVGAQVSYPDREGFGRRALVIARDTLEESLFGQILDLEQAARAAGTAVRYVKPHGALYNVAVENEDHAAAVVAATARASQALSRPLPVLGLPGSALLRLAAPPGPGAVTEAFADRGYTASGRLVPRGRDGAVLTPTQVHERVRGWLRTGAFSDLDGTPVTVAARSLCVHSDTPGAAALARELRMLLQDNGVRVESFVAPTTQTRA